MYRGLYKTPNKALSCLVYAKGPAKTLQDLMKHSKNNVFELPHFKLFWEDGVKEACPTSYHWLAPSAIADRPCFTCTFTKSLEKALL